MRRAGGPDPWVLGLLGAGVVGVAAWSASWEDSRSVPGSYAAAVVLGLALWGLAAAWILRRRPRGALVLGLVVLAALGARVALVPSAPDLSGDVNRYVWDGRVQADGTNPYRFPPEHPALAHLRDDAVYPGINRKPVTTIYPPAAQAAFLGLHVAGARTVTTLKLAWSLIDVVSVLLLALLLARIGRPPALAALYAWHPLAILEVGRSGHVDALAVALLLAALVAHTGRRAVASGALLAAATLVKFYVAAVLPALLWLGGRRSPSLVAAFGLTAVTAYLPYLGVGAGVLGYLPGYLEEEGFESGRRFHLLARLEELIGDLALGPVASSTWYPALVALAMGGLAAWCVRRPPASVRATLDRVALLLVALMVLTSPTYPWYLVLLLPLVPLASPAVAAPAAVMCAAAPLLYLQWWLPSSPGWPRDLTWGLGAAALAGSALVVRRSRRRAARATPAPRHPAASPPRSARPAPRRDPSRS